MTIPTYIPFETYSAAHPVENASSRVYKPSVLSEQKVTAQDSVTARSLAVRFAERANVLDFGALGDGVSDDTNAIRMAMATGQNVYFPGGKTYKITGSLTISINGQTLYGDGPYQSNLKPVGNFDVFVATAYENATVMGFFIDGSGLIGGYVCSIQSGNRVLFSNLRIDNCWGFTHVYHCNCADFHKIVVQSPRGPKCIYMHGTDANRTDVIRFTDMNVGGNSDCPWDGIFIDGAVFSVIFLHCSFVNYRRGMVTQNTMGGQAPQYIVVDDLEFDYGAEEVLLLNAGDDFWFHQLYAQGAGYQSGTTAASRAVKVGIIIGSAVHGVKFTNSYMGGSTGSLVEIGGQDIFFTDTQVVMPGFTKQFFTYDCVNILGTAKRVHFTGGQFGGREGIGLICRYGFTVAAGAQSITIMGCDTFGCMAGPLLDNTTNLPGNVVMQGVQSYGSFVNERTPGFEMGIQDGAGATATATISGGVITGITITNGGKRYVNPPAVLFWDPAGTGINASATAVLTNGVVTGVSGLVGGSNYSTNTKMEIRSSSSPPTIQASWPGQTNMPMRVRADGGDVVDLGNGRGTGFQALALDNNSVNFLQAVGRASGTMPNLFASGPDTNIDLGIVPKGTGKINLVGAIEGTAGAGAGYLNVKINGTSMKIPYFLP